MNKREFQRKQRIEKIITTLTTVKEQNKIYDKEKLLIHLMYEFGCSRRVAKEYLMIAEGKVNGEF